MHALVPQNETHAHTHDDMFAATYLAMSTNQNDNKMYSLDRSTEDVAIDCARAMFVFANYTLNLSYFSLLLCRSFVIRSSHPVSRNRLINLFIGIDAPYMGRLFVKCVNDFVQ